ncbi:MAG: hypothetical protein ACLR76_07885 [Alistipes sp.]
MAYFFWSGLSAGEHSTTAPITGSPVDSSTSFPETTPEPLD